MVLVEPSQPPLLARLFENWDSLMPLSYDLYIFHGKSAGEHVQKAAAEAALHRKVGGRRGGRRGGVGVAGA